MSTEERDESQPRPRKIIPSIRRENTDQEGERRPYNQDYNRPEGNNYERRPYNRPERDDRGGYRSYGENRPSYGENRNSYGNSDRPSRPERRPYGEGEGGNARPSFGNNRPSYGNREGGGGYNKPSYGNRPSYGNSDRPQRPSYGN
ncbi:MAG: pseudouridine synthase, partial [Parabacteroides sp.]|nr:pseudouridine synthase [Parabacteroides sp.]